MLFWWKGIPITLLNRLYFWCRTFDQSKPGHFQGKQIPLNTFYAFTDYITSIYIYINYKYYKFKIIIIYNENVFFFQAYFSKIKLNFTLMKLKFTWLKVNFTYVKIILNVWNKISHWGITILQYWKSILHFRISMLHNLISILYNWNSMLLTCKWILHERKGNLYLLKLISH